MRVDGANDGVCERRRELLERLNDEAAAGAARAAGAVLKKAASQHYWAKWFTIADKHQAAHSNFIAI